jgi:hypothetical protein
MQFLFDWFGVARGAHELTGRGEINLRKHFLKPGTHALELDHEHLRGARLFGSYTLALFEGVPFSFTKNIKGLPPAINVCKFNELNGRSGGIRTHDP